MSNELNPPQSLSRQELRRQQREQRKFNPYSPVERAAIASNAEKIIACAKKKGITKSRREQQLWRPHDFIPAKETLSALTEETVLSALTNIKETLSLMEKSENKLFTNSFAFFEEHQEEITLLVNTDEPLTARDRAAFMGVRFRIDEETDTYSWLLDVDPQYMAISPPFYAAISFVHEKQHLEDFMKIQAELPASTTAAERLQIHQTRLHSDDIYMIDEARGWGAQCDAVITEYGLGFEGSLSPSLMKLTADYASLGADKKSDIWKKYVAKNIFGLSDSKT